MKELTKETTSDFLNRINHLGGANINSIDFNFTKNDSSICSKFSISIKAQIECSDDIVHLEMRNILKYRLADLNDACSLYGLCGYPESLMIVWGKDSVVIALGVIVDEINYENLISSHFFIESKSLYVNESRV